MIMSDNVNEFIYNMKLKKSLLGGIKEEVVYDNMRKLSDLYEAQVNDLKSQIELLTDKNASLEKTYQEMLESKSEELNKIKNQYLELMKLQQDRLSQFMEVCAGLSDEMSRAIEQ